MKILEDVGPPVNAPLAAKYKKSFAFPSMNERTPVILTKIIDYLVRDKKNIISNHGESVDEELKAVIGEISQLKNHLQTAKTFLPFTTGPDAELWNTELENRRAKSESLNYYESDWLFAECYLYRRIHESFATKRVLKTLDPFSFQKDVVLTKSISEVEPLLKRSLEKLCDTNKSLDDGELRSQCAYFTKCSLWANRLDLSLSGGSTNINLDLSDLVNHWDENILVNDANEVISLILKGSTPVIDIVTDNGGLEILNDLVLADFLVTKCNVNKIRFRVKPMPWYVSDVTIPDFYKTVDLMAENPLEHCKNFGERWKRLLNSGKWEVTAESFWCLGLSYSDMPSIDPELFAKLKTSSLVIFKGDLNYRKLVRDRNWEFTVPFKEALGRFADIRLLALRTCKADTIAGLQADVAKNASSRSSDWLISGEFGLIQYNEGDCRTNGS